jgi:hypothetical protein
VTDHGTPDERNDGSHPRDVDAGSFKDPSSRVFVEGGTVYRALDERAADDWLRLQDTRFFANAVTAGRIIGTSDAPDVAPIDGPEWSRVVRHDTIPVITYPYEWTFSMLRDAALLQLELLLDALSEGMIMKDATPFNVQWRGPHPTFIDIGSFETLERGDVWVGYRQFLSQYLYPLLLTSRTGLPFQPWLRGHPDGISADELRRVMSAADLLRKGGLLHVAMPARAERRGSGGGRDVRSELKEAGFSKAMIEANVKGLHKLVSRLAWHPGTSAWNRYATECGHVHEQRSAKADFVERAIGDRRYGTVWDVGANDGHFSRLVADRADSVLALDADVATLDELYRSLAADGPDNILPVVQDLADPSPGLGWRGTERGPLSARSSPDLVLALAVVHHLVIGRNIPLGAVVSWLRDLDAAVILEFVSPDDPMVRALTANKRPREVHRDYTEGALRAYLDGPFQIEHEVVLAGGTRTLFSLRPGE